MTWVGQENNSYGYHKKKINKGEVGKISKIREELEELEDASEQGNLIMCLCELSDIWLAMDKYLQFKFSGEFDMDDVACMARATEEAFKSGYRK